VLIVDDHAYRASRLTWAALAIVLAATSVLVATVNLGAWAYLRTFPVNPGVSRVWQKWQLIELQKAPVDWLVLGDSTCGQGIIPDVVEEDTGETALNLCTVANATVVNGAWQLERYVERVGPPKKAIFFHAFHIWTRPTADLVSLFSEIPLEAGFYRRLSPPLDLGFLGDLDVMTRPLRTLWLSNLSVDYALRREVAALFSSEPFVRSDAMADLDYIIRHKGYVSSNVAMPERVIKESAAYAKSYAKRNFEITADNEAALRAVCDLSRKYGFQVYLANSSISRILYQDPGFQTFYAKMVARLSAIVRDCPSMKYIMKVPAQFETKEMDNQDHVVTDAVAARLTRDLVAAVRDADAGR
jgi:hypothetical protein